MIQLHNGFFVPGHFNTRPLENIIYFSIMPLYMYSKRFLKGQQVFANLIAFPDFRTLVNIVSQVLNTCEIHII